MTGPAGLCAYCELGFEPGEPWVRVTEGAQGYTSTVMLHAEVCLENWTDRTQPLDTKVAVTREIDIETGGKE